MSRKTISRIISSVTIIAAVFACGTDDLESPSDRLVSAVIVSLPRDTLTSLGESIQLTAEVRDEDGAAMQGRTVTWAVSDTGVVILSSSGTALAMANGTTTVTATVDGVMGTATLVVWQEVTEITMVAGADTIYALGEELPITVTARDSGGRIVVDPEVLWTSSDSSVMSLSPSGTAVSAGNGIAEITAASGTVSVSDTVVVQQVAVAIEISPPTDTIVQTGWVDLHATFLDANDYPMEPEPLSWTSTDDGTASVTTGGTTHGHIPGQVTISASRGGLTGESAITVSAPEIRLAPRLPSLFTNDTMLLEVAVLAPNGDRVNSGPLTWESANGGVAAVSDAVISGVSPGLARISAELVGVSDTVEVAVIDPLVGVDREIAYSNLNWPDGGSSTKDVRTVTLDGQTKVRVSTEGWYATEFAWSSSGERLAINYVVSNEVGEAGTFVTLPDGSVEFAFGAYLWAPHWNPADDRITYRNYIGSGESDVYTIGPDGSGSVQLTSGNGDELEPRWSPDGRRILYRDPVVGSTDAELWIMNADGSNPKKVQLPTAVNRPRWSPDGKFIAFNSEKGIWLVDAFGNFRPVTDNCSQDGSCSGSRRFRDVSWSPDGTRLAFWDVENGEVFVIDRNGANRRMISEGGSPDWSPSGDYIAFAAVNLDGRSSIAIVRPDGTGKLFLTYEGSAGLPQWR